MATQIRRDLYADVTSRKRPAETVQGLDWPHKGGGQAQAEGGRQGEGLASECIAWATVASATR
jgi:hypothetical protein